MRFGVIKLKTLLPGIRPKNLESDPYWQSLGSLVALTCGFIRGSDCNSYCIFYQTNSRKKEDIFK